MRFITLFFAKCSIKVNQVFYNISKLLMLNNGEASL